MFLFHRAILPRQSKIILSKIIIMKSLKFFSAIILSASVFFISCKKEKETGISKDQLVGKWTTVLVTSQSQTVQVKLKDGSGAELDVQPYDGIPEFIGVWELN